MSLKERPTKRSSRSRAALVLFCLASLAAVRPPVGHHAQESSDSHFQSIRALIDGGRYSQAELEAERWLSMVENAQDGPMADRAPAIDLLVEALACNGKGAEARTRALAQQAIQSKETLFGSTHPGLAPSLRNLGRVLIEAGEYQLAISPIERAAGLDEQALGGNQLELVEDLDLLVQGLTLIEKYDQALATSDRTLNIERALSPTDTRIARTLELRGLLLQRRSDYADARRALERALSLREAANPEHPRIAETLSLVKEQHQLEGDLVGAREFGEKALAVAERTLRPDHPDIAAYARSLAIPVANLGDPARARALRERGLAIAEKALGPDHPLVAVQLNDLAISFFTEGDYLRARALYDRALSAYERRLGPDHSRVLTELYNLALVSDKLGDFAEARRQFVHVIKAWERVFGREHPFVALVADALAESLSTQGKHAEARAWYERALAIRERTGGTSHPDVARTLTMLSASVAKLGQIQHAYELSARALKIWEQLPTGDTQRVAASLMVHGTNQADRGDYSAARVSYERALGILRRIVGPSHPDVAEAYVPLAATLARMDEPIEALRNALDAEKIGRDHLRLMLRHLPERQGLEYAATRPKGLDFAMSLFTPALDRTDADHIFDEVVRSRGLVIDEMADRRHLAADAARPELTPLWSTLVSARQRFANLVIRGSNGLKGDQYATLLDQARREKEDAERALAEKSATFRADLLRTEVGLGEIRAALPTNTALVAFARYDRTLLGRSEARARSKTPVVAPAAIRKPVPSYVAFVVRAGQPDVLMVRLGSAVSIDALVARWRREAADIVRASAGGDAESTYRAVGAELRRRVWDPVATQLKGTSTVLVVPDGTLNTVSFAALPASQTKYVIDERPVIHYLSAERDLVAAPTPTSNHGLLAVGGAAFDDATLFTRRAPRPSGAQARTGATGSAPPGQLRASCGDLTSVRFEPLAATTKEVREVARLWTESPAQLLENRGATERAFKQAAPGHRVLHLATHGFFLGSTCSPAAGGTTRSVGGLTTASKKPPNGASNGPSTAATESPLLLSGLALAGANRRASAGPDEDDGILTAEEVTGLNLDGVEWAVLSACDTGLGEVKVGEGVLGLRRAFQVAGVRTVIMSLWSVEDQATLEWMRALYASRLQKKLSTADATRDASLTVLRARRARGLSTHPFYWGAFVAAGDWR